MGILLIILILLFVFGSLPPVSGGWHNMGYGPSGIGLILVVVLIVLLLTGRL